MSIPPDTHPDTVAWNDAHAGDALLASLRRDYDVVTRSVEVASRVYHLLTVRDTNVLLDAIDPVTFGVDERLPYWAELWPSARALAEHTALHLQLQDAFVLELGCGLGLNGMVAAAAGAHVTLTDYEPDALAFARFNTLTNLNAHERMRVRIRDLDWHRPVLDRTYDLILGADIVYERKDFSALLRLLRDALRPDGAAVLADPDRTMGADFFSAARQEGFVLRTIPVPHPVAGVKSFVNIVELRSGARA